METEKMDLSALDPMREPERWQRVVEATLARAERVVDARRDSANDAFWLIANWRRRLIAAAAVVIAALIPAELALEVRESRLEAVHRLATVSVSWVERDVTPSGAEILRALAEGRRP